ncbi:MAG: hypothetical protein JO189_07275 [Deltaproteobacteria bacterium]|nr:hypothetical protein [Deltaproteobacteria bacterium]
MNVRNPVLRSEADEADLLRNAVQRASRAGSQFVQYHEGTTSAESCTLTTAVSAEGVSASLQPTAGGKAAFELEVTVTGESSFVESGTIRFGEGNHQLRFSTVGQGYLGTSTDPKPRHGSVTRRVEGGEGQFGGASGLITSNFTISEAGQVIDCHFGEIFVR